MAVRALKDCLDVPKVVAVMLIKRIVADGYQWTDIGAVLASPEFQKELREAIPAAPAVPGEVADLDFSEMVELFGYTQGFVMEVVDALKKPK